MSLKSFARISAAVIVLAGCGAIARADEIVHFTNGAEMTVRAHVVVNDMLKLDLGGNNSISFPIAMVGKIVNAGQDVFVNRVYYPANQAVPEGGGGVSVARASDTVSRGGGPPVGLTRQGGPGKMGVRLGEAMDNVAPTANFGSGAVAVRPNPRDDFTTAERPKFDPLRELPPGGVATIEPPAGQVKRPSPQMAPRTQPAPVEPAPPGATQNPPQGDDTNQDDPPPQDPPQNR